MGFALLVKFLEHSEHFLSSAPVIRFLLTALIIASLRAAIS